MAVSWTEFRKRVKSRCSAWGRSLWLGRRKYAGKCRRLKRENAEGAARQRELEAELQREREAHQACRVELQRREALARVESPRLPDDPPLAGHGYGPKLMSLCANLARRVGLRAAEARTFHSIPVTWAECVRLDEPT